MSDYIDRICSARVQTKNCLSSVFEVEYSSSGLLNRRMLVFLFLTRAGAGFSKVLVTFRARSYILKSKSIYIER